MTQKLKGERTLMRIFLGKSDRCRSGPYRGRPLHEALLLTLRDRGCAGATVVRAVAGFVARAVLHTGKVLRLSSDLPIIVEEEEERRLQQLLRVQRERPARLTWFGKIPEVVFR